MVATSSSAKVLSDGNDMFAHACKIGLEGVVSKVRNSHYPTRRGRDWVKKTCAQRETLTIAGFALDGGDWSGIYLGRRKGNKLIYAGKVDHGFDKKSSAELRERLHSPDPQNPTLHQADRAQADLGGAGVARGNRISCQVRGGKAATSFFQRTAGRFMSPAVWAYVDTSKQVGDPDHLKLFCQSGGGRRVFFCRKRSGGIRVSNNLASLGARQLHLHRST